MAAAATDMPGTGVSGIWEKLPPGEFKELQEYTKCKS